MHGLLYLKDWGSEQVVKFIHALKYVFLWLKVNKLEEHDDRMELDFVDYDTEKDAINYSSLDFVIANVKFSLINDCLYNKSILNHNCNLYERIQKNLGD